MKNNKGFSGTTHPLQDLQNTRETKRAHRRTEHMGDVARKQMRTHEEVESDEPELDEALNIQQRQKRAIIMRRYKSKIERAREVAKHKVASEQNIRKRSYAQARQIFRKRLAGDHGAEYEKLGPSEKIAIDKMLDSKGKAIKKLALRLIPRVKKAEYERLKSYMKGQSLVNHGSAEGKISEEFNDLFLEYFGASAPGNSGSTGERSMNPISNEKSKKPEGKSKNKQIEILGKFDMHSEENTAVFQSLQKKSNNSGIDLDILGEVFDRGLDAWSESYNVSPTQYAFARVNSFINKGKTYYTEDADLQQGILSFSEKNGLWDNIHAKRKRIKAGSGERMRKPGSKGAPTDAAIKAAQESVELGEGVDKNHPIIKQYNALKKHDIKSLRSMISQNSRVADTSEFKTKDHAISHLLRQRHGHKKVDQAFGFSEEVEQIDETPKSPAELIKNKIKKAEANAKARDPHTKIERDEARVARMLAARSKQRNEELELDEMDLRAAIRNTPTKKQLEDKHKKEIEYRRERIKLRKEETELDEMKDKDPCWKGYEMIGKKKKNGKEVPNCVPEEVEVEESNNTPYVKAHIEKGATKQSGWKASNKHGNVKYFGMDFKKSAEKHAGIAEARDPNRNTKLRQGMQYVERDATPETPDSDATHPTSPCSDAPRQQRVKKRILEQGNVESDPKKRLIGTDSLVKAYKKDTPGESLDESFAMAFDYQGRPSVAPTASELHMRAQGGFAHHTDVQNVMEVTDIKNKIQAMFETTILEEDKDQLAISFNELTDMVQDAYAIIHKIKESTIERDAWSEAQILKMERYIQSVNAYLDNMYEDVTAADRKGEVVAGHKAIKTDPKTGEQITVNVPSHVRKAPTGKKIIKSGSPNDGIPG